MSWIAIFKTGKHTDSQGNTREWTHEDLDKIVEKYDPKQHEAPAVIGHPQTNSPAWGWVEGLKREGDLLLAKFKDLVPEFVEMLRKKMFKKRSISLYPDLTLRHVGFLGAAPPAVKGLPDFQFQENDLSITIEFSEWQIPIIGRIFSRLRDFLIDKFDLETADRIISPWEIEDLTKEPVKEELSPAYSEGNEPKKEGLNMPTIEELQQQLEEQKRQIAEFSQKMEKVNQEKETLQQQLEKEKRDKRKKEFSDFCDQLIKEGKLLPKNKEKVLFFMEILGDSEMEFSEGEDQDKKSGLDIFKEFLESMPKQVEMGEFATKGKAGSKQDVPTDFSGNVDEERLELHQKATELSEKENISYREALRRVI